MLGKLYTMVWCSVFFPPGRSEGAVLCGWTAGGSGRMQGQSGAALCGAELQWSPQQETDGISQTRQCRAAERPALGAHSWVLGRSAPIPVPHRPPQQGETSQTFICTHPSAS